MLMLVCVHVWMFGLAMDALGRPLYTPTRANGSFMILESPIVDHV